MMTPLKEDNLKIAFNDALIGRPASFKPRKNLIVLELDRASKSPKANPAQVTDHLLGGLADRPGSCPRPWHPPVAHSPI